jgi:hypothetical protein
MTRVTERRKGREVTAVYVCVCVCMRERERERRERERERERERPAGKTQYVFENF